MEFGIQGGVKKLGMAWIMLLLFSWTPVCEVCPNYVVVMLQPLTGNSLNLRAVANCYVAMILGTASHLRPPPNVHPGGQLAPGPSVSPSTTFLSPHRIILPPGLPLSSSQHTNIIFSLIQITLPPLIPCPLSACRFPLLHSCRHQNIF